LSREEIAEISQILLVCIAGMTLLTAMFAAPKIPQLTFLLIK
jgi:hypothetical protein